MKEKFLLAKLVAFRSFTKSLFSFMLLLKFLDVLSGDLFAISFVIDVFLGVWEVDAIEGGKIN